jgi:hypothetical protein
MREPRGVLLGMRIIHFFNLIIMSAVALFTWNAIAMPADLHTVLRPMKMHILENLDKTDSAQAEKLIAQRGYQVSYRPLFSESNRALIITRTIADEFEPASIQIEMVKMEGKNTLPKTVFIYKAQTADLAQALTQLPKPNDLIEQIAPTPAAMAFQSPDSD